VDLQNKIFVITGGSKGIGESLVRKSSELGAKVLFTYNSGEVRAVEIAKETGSEYKKLILGDKKSTDELFEFLSARGKIDYFIANAGIELSGDLKKHSFEKIQEIINVNLIGNLYMLQKLITNEQMKERGQISVIGSVAADGNKNQLAYSASKSGLRGAIESLVKYDEMVKEQKLGIKLLEPAFVRTPLTKRILNVLEGRYIPLKGGNILLKRFKDEKIVMEVEYASQEILKLTTYQTVIGIRTIPPDINIHKIRETYF